MSDPTKHEWKSQRQGGNPANAESYEWVTFCTKCGIEYPGKEFLDRIPDCDAVIWANENG